MALHKLQFDIDFSEVKNSSLQEKVFIYRNSKRQINAWRIYQEDSGLTILNAFSENDAGTMILQDVLKPDLPIKVTGIESDGCLVAEIGQGALRYSHQGQRINTHALLDINQEKLQWASDHEIQPTIFPGMRISDRLRCGDLILSRHETTARKLYGELLYPESLLLVNSDHVNHNDNISRPVIIIGNSQVDNSLQLVQCLDHQLFEIPIIDFVLDYQPNNEMLLLIGWNRKMMQVVRISEGPGNDYPIISDTKELLALDNIVLSDYSSALIGGQGRLSFWRDMLSPATFYTWDRD